MGVAQTPEVKSPEWPRVAARRALLRYQKNLGKRAEDVFTDYTEVAKNTTEHPAYADSQKTRKNPPGNAQHVQGHLQDPGGIRTTTTFQVSVGGPRLPLDEEESALEHIQDRHVQKHRQAARQTREDQV